MTNCLPVVGCVQHAVIISKSRCWSFWLQPINEDPTPKQAVTGLSAARLRHVAPVKP